MRNGRPPADAGARRTVPRRRTPPSVPLLLLAGSFPVALALPTSVGPVVGLLLRIVGVIWLWMSVHWSGAHKAIGVVVTALLPAAVVRLTDVVGHPDVTVPVANVLILLLPVAGAGWLWRVRRRPGAPGPVPRPRPGTETPAAGPVRDA